MIVEYVTANASRMIAPSGKGDTANDACYSVAEERLGLDDSFRVPLSITSRCVLFAYANTIPATL